MEKFTPKRITIHCSATRDGSNVSVETIRSWHRDRGFSDIGYHYLIGIDGTVHIGRPITEIGAHVENANSDNVGVCLVGNSLFTLKQFESLKILTKDLMATYSIPEWEVYCHNEFRSAQKQGKVCPNFRIANLLSYLFRDKYEAIDEYILK